MNIVNINESISNNVFNKLIEFYNKKDSKDEFFETNIIYLSTSGGCTIATEGIIDLINKYKNITTVIAYGKIYSSGFDIFYKVNCKKIILNTCIGMYHQSSQDITINEDGKPNFKTDVADLLYMKLQKLKTIKFAEELNFSIKELSSLNKGKDVYFQYDRLKELLENQHGN